MIHDDHEDIIKRGIDNRMDLYRLIFLLVQIVALFFLALKVYWRNNELQVKFLARVKKRLIVINEEQNLKLEIKLTDEEQASLKPKKKCLWPNLEWIRAMAVSGKNPNSDQGPESDQDWKDLWKGCEGIDLKEDCYGKFSNITKDTKFEVGGKISREIQGQLVHVIEKLARLTDTSFGDVIINLRDKIEDESKRQEFTRFIDDWFEHQEKQKGS